MSDIPSNWGKCPVDGKHTHFVMTRAKKPIELMISGTATEAMEFFKSLHDAYVLRNVGWTAIAGEIHLRFEPCETHAIFTELPDEPTPTD